ncbi:MAG: DNA-3-methyladenine glycosylase I [Proteobacteria bacterium]|nr:DNA-3-methyladenine glycosylase I [Pseudomonadota bacterium]MBU1387419.1 DNA-3-methyladenine glycosylase I [Pseudomonadota bacterium]MBU1541704.1 DNA-3-methyladenine glycosylase I [Pseudomonadota bacterium]MBU2429724.1 DNA-3-methyladenine glycosylase I [Pseudomonadota bacterium]MBU2481993.1 DNA-3-methyladenine glycosylase I [Pseudomonadota bacterium]
MKRCDWVTTDPDYIEYHDTEWGVPVHDDKKLFEFLILEGAQAGLSWLTILKRRDGYRKAFADFEVQHVAAFTPENVQALLLNPAIIRNRLKIHAAITNARAFIKIQEQFGSFDNYAWQFVDGRPVTHFYKTQNQVPASTDVSKAFSRDLKQRGFKFVGPTIMYAHMQATGMVNDHLVCCFRHSQILGKTSGS